MSCTSIGTGVLQLIKKENRVLFIICILGCCIRVVYAITQGDELVFPDEERYWCQINNLLESYTFYCKTSYAHDMPFAAVIMAVFLKVSGAGLLALRLFLALISSILIYIVAKFTKLFSENPIAPVLAGAIVAVYPFFIFYSSLILSESIFTLISMGYFYYVFKAAKDDWVYLGVLSGLGYLTRPTLLFFYPIIWIWLMVVGKFSAKRIALIITLTMVVISPWLVRNYKHFDTVVIATASTGHVLWEGNNPWNKTGGVAQPDWKYLDDMPLHLTELERDKWKKRQAIEYISSNPLNFFVDSLKKFSRFWHLWPNNARYNQGVYFWLSLLSFGPILAGAIAGLWLLRNHWRTMGLLWLFFAYYTLLHMVTIGSIRYRLPLEPLLIVLASCSFTQLMEFSQVSWFFKRDRTIE